MAARRRTRKKTARRKTPRRKKAPRKKAARKKASRKKAPRKAARQKGRARSTGKARKRGTPRYCCQLLSEPRILPPEVGPRRARLIRESDQKWVNGTVLHYYFFTEPQRWSAPNRTREVVRRAFDAWKKVGIGLEFREVDSPDEAEIRIGFERGDGAWSYVGREVLNQGQSDRTMNLGWDITAPGEIDTPIHEIGHTLGFPHEHQNPFSGIVWDEEAVYRALEGPPNRWDRETTWYNIIRKIQPDSVKGSSWDPDSIMHYAFEAGLIAEPAKYRQGLFPMPGISRIDREWVRRFYPPLGREDEGRLEPFRSVKVDLEPGEQVNFEILPDATRPYSFSTFGHSDTVMVLFEEVDGDLRYRIGDDDSGTEFNASFEAKLYKGRRYVLRVRLYYRWRAGDFAVMMW